MTGRFATSADAEAITRTIALAFLALAPGREGQGAQALARHHRLAQGHRKRQQRARLGR